MHRLLVVAIMCICVGACAPQQTSYSTPGALYVEGWSQGMLPKMTPGETLEYRSGQIVARLPLGLVVARDRPDRSLATRDIRVCGGPSLYRLSPDGTMALCAASNEQLRVVEVKRPAKPIAVLTRYKVFDDGITFAWLDNFRFAALTFDKSCPYATLYDYMPSRLMTFDRRGRLLATGPCAFGIVVGEHRVAILGEGRNTWVWHIWQFFANDPRYYNDGYDRVHHTWSVDGGKSWHDGMPLAFDGNDRLVYQEPFSDIVRSEHGDIVLTNVADVQRSR